MNDYLTKSRNVFPPSEPARERAMPLRGALLLLTCLAVVGLSGQSQAGLLFADDFQRPGSADVGNTATGNYPWVVNESDVWATWVNGSALVLNGGGGEPTAKSGSLYVDYSLTGVPSYRIDLTLAAGVGTVANGYWISIQPRGTGSYFSPGWFLRPDGAGINVSYYDGSTEVTIASAVFAKEITTAFSILVAGNTATLTVGSLTDTRTLAGTGGNPSYLGFAFESYSRTLVDSVSVTAVPEPGTLLLGMLGITVVVFRRGKPSRPATAR
jgi:hypothetical protein